MSGFVEKLQPRLPVLFNRRGAGGALLAMALLAGCGGGGGGDAATATSASYALGPITGYGSVVVNGVHFDESRASVYDEDGNRGSASALKLGVMVEIQGSAVDTSTLRSAASTIHFGSELKGAVTAVDTAGGLISMLDQTVAVTDTTVFDSSLGGGLAKVDELFKAGGTVVLEVHAQFDGASGRYVATRIELEDSASSYKLRGSVASLDTTAKTFQIGNAVINYAGLAATSLPSNLADGLTVRVRLQTAKVNDQWVATRVSRGVRHGHSYTSSDARLRGSISDFVSLTSFSVNGVVVDASNAAWPDGQTGVADGTWVEVKGALVDGVLVATKVELEGRRGHDDDRHKPEFEGTVSAVDTTAKTFQISGRSETISYASAVFKDGTAAGLVVGASVEVKARVASDGSLVARLIDFES